MSATSYKLQATSWFQWLIILFCIFHIFSIVVYSLPDLDPHSLTARFKQPLLPLIRPYLFLTSQWQQWNLFAPDPMQRVERYTVEVHMGSNWSQVAVLAPDSLPWWRMADELKLIGSLSTDAYKVLRDPYVRQYCEQLNLPAYTRVRMTAQTALISQKQPTAPDQWITRVYAETVCP